MVEYDIVVIGGGPAGMAAALSARAAGINRILLVERSEALGGILNQCIHRGFGLAYFGEELNGPEYAARFTKNIEESDINVLTATTVTNLYSSGCLVLSGIKYGLLEVKAKTVILASGCRERPIGTLPVAGTRPSGIFAAGMAQKMINLGRYDIGSSFVILGSGDIGMIVARRLTILGKRVIAVIEKEAACGGLPRNRIQCLEQYKIPLWTNSTISQIHGQRRLSGITVRNLSTGSEKYILCDTLITSIGLIPEQELAEEASVNSTTGEIPDWLFLCGNACYVHDLVDDVTLESEQVGRLAASFILNGKTTTQNKLASAKNKNDSGGVICLGCPKGCRLTLTEHGWEGAMCGRKEPVLSSVNYKK